MPLFPSVRILPVCLFALLVASDLYAQSTLIPLATSRGLVFDHSGNYLYITTSDGWVRPYKLSTGQLQAGYNLGGSLNGADITPDDSFLLIAQSSVGVSGGVFHKLNLNTGTVTNINYTRESGESGGWNVAIGSNGLAFVTTQFAGSGWTPLRQINMASNAISIRTDDPGSNFSGGVRQNTQIQRSADGTRLYFLEANSSDGPVFTYSAATDNFSPRATVGTFFDYAGAAVNRNGTLLATTLDPQFERRASLDTASDFGFLTNFHQIDSGLAFDATRDVLYGVNSSTDQIVAYDTNTFREKFRWNIGEDIDRWLRPFEHGTLVASANGRYIALKTDSGVRLFTVPQSFPAPTPSPAPVLAEPRDMVFDRTRQLLYINTEDGFVWPYDLSTETLKTPFYVGGSLYGMDIAADDSYLLIAQGDNGLTQGAVQKLNLVSGAVTNMPYKRNFLEIGVWNVAITSTGKAFLTTQFDGSGWGPLRQLDLANNSMSDRIDAPGSGSGGVVRQNTQIHRSADRTRLYFLEANISSGPLFTYNAATNTFDPGANTNSFLDYASAAVNRNGTLLGTRVYGHDASLDTAPDLNYMHSFSGLDSGVAFDGVYDRFYGVNSSTNQIIAYETNTFAELFRLSIGEDIGANSAQFSPGYLVASSDGRYLAMLTPTTIRLFSTGSPPSAQPANLSTRATVQTGDNVTIGGFIITGASAKRVILRAIGPSLSAAGVSGAMQDPVLELHDQTGAIITSNDNWKDTQQTEIQTSGLAPNDDHESAIVATLASGVYTAIMRGKNDTTGMGLVEIYDLDPRGNSTIANISTRGLVGTGDNVMIGGLIVTGPGGNNSSDKRILIRAIGPSLTQANVPNALADPVLELHNGNGTLIILNDNWKDTQQPNIQATGLAPADDRESAILATLVPGVYTAIVRGKNNSTGVGLVEVYGLQ